MGFANELTHFLWQKNAVCGRVRLFRGAIFAAGTVMTRNVPPYSIYNELETSQACGKRC
jgi:hypothetical protein